MKTIENETQKCQVAAAGRKQGEFAEFDAETKKQFESPTPPKTGGSKTEQVS